MPYILAFTTVLPALFYVTCLTMVVVLKSTMEPLRVIPESYMTFVKDEFASTQACGIILIISIIIGVAIGLLLNPLP
jgi:hypothetical protein